MHRSTTLRRCFVALFAVAALAGCGSDEPAEVADEVAEDVEEAADEVAEDIEDVADEAEETLDDAGVDSQAGGTAELAFRGEMLTIPADEGFGCFVTPDGGSQGAVSFEGTDEAGTTLVVDWAGDSPDSQFVSITTADGTEYQTQFGVQLDVVIDGSSASVNGKIAALADGSESDFFVTADCG